LTASPIVRSTGERSASSGTTTMSESVANELRGTCELPEKAVGPHAPALLLERLSKSPLLRSEERVRDSFPTAAAAKASSASLAPALPSHRGEGGPSLGRVLDSLHTAIVRPVKNKALRRPPGVAGTATQPPNASRFDRLLPRPRGGVVLQTGEFSAYTGTFVATLSPAGGLGTPRPNDRGDRRETLTTPTSNSQRRLLR
jgi:hypothetical protein